MSVTSRIPAVMAGRGRAGRGLWPRSPADWPVRAAGCGPRAGRASPAGAASARPRSGAARIARITAAARTGPQRACPVARPGEMSCFVLARPQYAVNRSLAAARRARPKGWTPRQLERAYQSACQAAQPSDDCGVDRRAHPRPGRLPSVPTARSSGCRRAASPAGACGSSTSTAGHPGRAVQPGHRLGRRGHPRRVDDLRGLPALQDPRRRGQQPVRQRPGPVRGHCGPARRPGDQQQLRHQGDRLLAGIRARLPAPRSHDRRLGRRRRL